MLVIIPLLAHGEGPAETQDMEQPGAKPGDSQPAKETVQGEIGQGVVHSKAVPARAAALVASDREPALTTAFAAANREGAFAITLAAGAGKGPLAAASAAGDSALRFMASGATAAPALGVGVATGAVASEARLHRERHLAAAGAGPTVQGDRP